MRKQGWFWAADICIAAVAAWIATSVVPAYRVEGTAAERLLTFLLFGAMTVIGRWVYTRPNEPLYRAASTKKSLEKRLRAYDKAGLPQPEELRLEKAKAERKGCGILVLTLPSALVLILTVVPGSMWLAATLAGALGLPAHRGGFWPAMVTGVVVYTLRSQLAQVVRLPIERRRPSTTVRSISEILLLLAGIAAAAGLLGGVSLDSAPWPRQLLTLFVLAVLFRAVRGGMRISIATTVLRIVANCVKLWCAAALTAWMAVSLRIDGFWDLLLAAIILTPFNVLLQVIAPYDEPKQDQPAEERPDEEEPSRS